ncbi:hypothetical protein D3C80_1411650 [compost metagenome]
MRGLGEDAVHSIAKGQLQAEGYAARRPTHATRQIHEQGMLRIHGNVGGRQLLLQSFGGDRIAQEQIDRVFIVDEMAGRIGLRLLAPLRNRHAVIR